MMKVLLIIFDIIAVLKGRRMGREGGKSGMERMRKEDKGSFRIEDTSLRPKGHGQSCAPDSSPVCVLQSLCCSSDCLLL